MNPTVSIIMGSTSDLPVMEKAAQLLDDMQVPFEMNALSAHRTPAEVEQFARGAEGRGIKVIIAAAGMAAALPGVIAANTPLPVIGVPVKGSVLDGVDALYSILQMPPGIPVATVAINGALNAAILAVQMLALADKELAAKDVDSDGFTVFEEFEAGSNPVDGKSYPDVVVRMRVKSFKGRALPFVFRSYSTLPDGKKSLAIFVPAESRTYYLKEGEPVAKTGFKVVRFIEKKEKRKDPKLGNMERVVDLSSIEVLRARDGKSAELVLERPSGIIDQEAVLTLEMDQFETTVETGSVFTLREKKYSVEKVDAVAKTVTIKESGGKTYVISSL